VGGRDVDDADYIDAALSELEKMLNDGLASTSSSSPGGPGPAAAAADNHSSVTVDCTHIPRLTGQLYYARSVSSSLATQCQRA